MHSAETLFFSVLEMEGTNVRFGKLFISQKNVLYKPIIWGEGGNVIVRGYFVVTSSRHIANCTSGMNMELKRRTCICLCLHLRLTYAEARYTPGRLQHHSTRL